jgi:hypothetical protein
MERVLLKDHLAQAERHIVEGRDHVERQRQIVEELVRRGESAGRSKALLELFEMLRNVTGFVTSSPSAVRTELKKYSAPIFVPRPLQGDVTAVFAHAKT